MKKFLVLLLTAALVLSCLYGCEGKNHPNIDDLQAKITSMGFTAYQDPEFYREDVCHRNFKAQNPEETIFIECFLLTDEDYAKQMYDLLLLNAAEFLVDENIILSQNSEFSDGDYYHVVTDTFMISIRQRGRFTLMCKTYFQNQQEAMEVLAALEFDGNEYNP